MRTPLRWVALLTLLLGAGGAHAELIDGVAAVVGEDVILRSDLDELMRGPVETIRAKGGTIAPDEMREMRKEALQSLIDDRLMMQVAERGNLGASEVDIDKAISSIALDEGISESVIYASAAKQGMPRERYREQLGKQITRMRIVSGSVQQRVSVTDQEVRDLFDERYANARPGRRIRVLHILAPFPPEATPAQRAQVAERVAEVRQQALDTGDFAGLARAYSSAPQGGMTVLFEEEAPPEILAALEGLSAGQITEVVETPYGLNLFQYLEEFDLSEIEYEQVAAQLRAELLERKTMPEFRKWLDELRESRYIEVVIPDLK